MNICVNETEPFSCPICDKTFDSKRGRGVHLSLGHDDETIKDVLLAAIDTLAEQREQTPRYSEMKQHGTFSPNMYSHYFDSYGSACRKAGYELKTNDTTTYHLSEEDLLADLHTLVAELGAPPTKREIQTHSTYSTETYIRRFGSTNNALKQAGYEPTRYWSHENALTPVSYGDNWNTIRNQILSRDGHTCRVCNRSQTDAKPGHLAIHHITPARQFGAADSDTDTNYEEMNRPDNLITLCPTCHRTFEGQYQESTPTEFTIQARSNHPSPQLHSRR